MAKYLIHCDTSFCGVNEDVIVEASSESEAEDIAAEWWTETVETNVSVEREMETDDDEIDFYQEIN